MYYKALGWVVWKGGTWYLRRRYSTAPKKKIGAGAVVAFVIATVVVIAQKRLAARSDD
jgi:uncharacterized membrane protein YhfC